MVDLLVVFLAVFAFQQVPVAALGASGAVLAGVGYVLAANQVADGIRSRAAVGRRGSVALLLVGAIAVRLPTAGPGVAVAAHVAGFVMGAVAGRVRALDAGNRSGQPPPRGGGGAA